MYISFDVWLNCNFETKTYMTVLIPLSCWNNCKPHPTIMARLIFGFFSMRIIVEWLPEKYCLFFLIWEGLEEAIYLRNYILLLWMIHMLIKKMPNDKMN